MSADVVVNRSREQRTESAKVNAVDKGRATREWVDRRAKDVAFGTKLSAGVVGGFVRGFFRK